MNITLHKLMLNNILIINTSYNIVKDFPEPLLLNKGFTSYSVIQAKRVIKIIL